MYVIICLNQSDPYCGTEAIICDNKYEVLEELEFINKHEVFNIFKVCEDVKNQFLRRSTNV